MLNQGKEGMQGGIGSLRAKWIELMLGFEDGMRWKMTELNSILVEYRVVYVCI